jgi:hypothetical protein
MQTVQRQFGKFMKRSADESQISVLLKDFEDADILLAKVRSIPQRALQSTLPISILDPSLNEWSYRS